MKKEGDQALIAEDVVIFVVITERIVVENGTGVAHSLTS